MAINAGVGFDIDFKQLEQEVKNADKALASMLKTYEKLANNIGKKSAKGKQSKLSGELSQMEELSKVLKNLSNKNLKLNIDASNLNKLKNELKAIIDYTRALNNPNADSKSAMKYSREAKSANESREAINRLNRARSQEDLSTRASRKRHAEMTQEIERQKRKYKELTSTVRSNSLSLKDSLGGIGQAIAAAFSINAIKGYINNLIRVRGEFELQQRSLKAIIQDNDAADKLWSKTVALAIKSPFRVGELVTYTKQLAAFRIETEKLYDTNKMLADISSGLGVEMNRLILAFGQVRAANYLRGQELRQFSEAGVNILGELSAYFTELEGRTVTVGDVFERVSKRLVLFEDVEKVLQRLTQEGGIFYNMQEIQAETLKGKISNLKDSIDVMLNEMGKENEGALKGSVDALKGLIENWRDLADLLQTIPVKIMAITIAANALGRTKFISRFAAVVPGMNWALSKMDVRIRALSMSTKLFSGTLGGLLKLGRNLLSVATGGVVLAIIGILVKKTAEWYLEATKVEREFGRLDKKLGEMVSIDVSSINKTVDTYKNLVDRLKETNEGSAARAEIIGKINSQYGEYLDYMVDETTTVEKLEDSYGTLVERMKEKASMATFEKGFEEIENTFNKLLSDVRENFVNSFFVLFDISDNGEPIEIVPTEKEIDSLFDLIMENMDLLSDEEKKDNELRKQMITESVKAFYGNENYSMSMAAMENALKYVDVLLMRKEEERKLQERINESYEQPVHSQEAMVEIEKAKIKYEEKLKEIREKNAYDSKYDLEEAKRVAERAFNETKARILYDFNQISMDEYYKRVMQIFNWEDDWVKPINETIKREFGESAEYTKDQWTQILISIDEQAQGKSGVIKNINDEWKRYTEILANDISLKSAGVLVSDEDIKNTRKMIRLYERLAELMGVELKTKQKIDESAVAAINYRLAEEYQITLEEAEKTHQELLDDSIKKRDEAIKQLKLYNIENEQGISTNEKLLQLIKEQVNQYTLRADLLGAYNKDRINSLTVESVNALLDDDYIIKEDDLLKSQADLISQAKKNMDAANQLKLNYNEATAKGTAIPQYVIDRVDKDIEQYTKLWELLGGFVEEKEKNTRSRHNSLYDERIKVITDMNKKYKELNRTLNETTSMQGAFDAYIGAFAKAYEDVSFIPKNVEKMSVDDFVKNVFNFPDEDKIVDFLDRLAKEPMKAFEEIKVRVARGDFFLDMQTRIKKDEDKKLIKEVEALFDRVNLSKELHNMGFGDDIADIFNFDYIDLSGLRDTLSSMRDRFIGSDMQKEYENYFNKIDEMEQKSIKDRMKQYSKYLLNSMSESVKIKTEEIKKKKEIEELAAKTGLSEDKKEQMLRGVEEETIKALQKQQWKDFKDSETYSLIFDDIEYLGTRALEKLRDKLEDLKGSLGELDATEVKEIMAQISKIEDVTISRNPFKAISKIEEELKKLKSEDELQIDLFDAQSQVEASQSAIDKIDIINNKKTQGVELTKEETDWIESIVGAEGDVVEGLAKERALRVANVKQGQKDAQTAQRGLNTYKNKRKALDKESEAWGKIGDYANSAFESAKSLMSALGVSADSVAMSAVESAQSFATLTIQAIQFTIQMKAAGIAAKSALGIIGYILMAIEAIVALISVIVGAKDKGLEQQIEQHKILIDKLKDSYEKLEKAIDEAWSVEQLSTYSRKATETTRKLMAEQEAMIAAQKQRKGALDETTDNGKELRDMEKELEEYKEQLADTMKDIFSTATGGILDSVRDAAQEFTDAWYDAFKETGDGLSGLEENFNEMFENLAKTQASQIITGKYVDAWKAELEKIINANTGDTIMTSTEAKNFAENVKKTLPELSSSLQAFFDALSGTLVEGTSGELSELQKGIQGLTEDTGQVLESLLNSIRLFVASNNEELKQQTKYMRNLWNLFDSIGTTSHPQGGIGLKVCI